MRRLSLLALVVSALFRICESGSAQVKISPAPAAPAARYAAEPIVVNSLEDIYHMEADGTGFEERSCDVLIQSESALKDVAILSIPFAANSQKVEWVYVRLRHKDGSVTETPVTGGIEVAEQVTREAPLYSDLKQMQLPLRDLRVGDRLEWRVRVLQTKPEAAGQFWGQHSFQKDSGVVLSEKLVLDVPNELAVTVWSPDHKPVATTAGARKTYVFTSQSLRPTVGPEAEAFKAAETKRVRTAEEELSARQGKLPDVAWTTFKSWDEVGAWYRGLEGERTQPDAGVRAKAAELTAGKTSTEAKVQALYTYVATQIHYIGVDFGVGRYQPHAAAEILTNQYGDCKDKHTLLAAMLESIGIHPDAVLIGVNIRFNPAVPSPAAFNHVISRVSVEGKPVWLDTTAEVAPYGMLLYATRDHDALVIPPQGVARVEHTPAAPPFPAFVQFNAAGKLTADGESDAKIVMTFRGDEEIAVRAVLRQISPAQYDQLAKAIFNSIGYAGTATLETTTPPEDTTQPITLTFDYKRSKPGDWDDLRVAPQLYPVLLPHPDEKDPPIVALSLGPPRVETSTAQMTLPEGWTVELPEAMHERSKWFTYDITYRFSNGVVSAERKVEVLQERVPVAEQEAYRKFADKISLGNESMLQLVRKTSAKAASGSVAGEAASGSTANPNGKSAEALVQEAFTDLERHDLPAAHLLLDAARTKNPKQPGLWQAYGYLEYSNGELSAAVKDYDRELALHPANLSVYSPMVSLQLVSGQRVQAEDSLRHWSDAAPNDPAPVRQLASLQLEDEHPQLALATVQAALARMAAAGSKPDETLQLTLGRAQLAAGKKEDGHQTLALLLRSTDDPGMMNDTAYELADAGLELPLAEEKTAKALELYAHQTQSWTLDENLDQLRATTRLIEATWDTLGWIQFKEGKLDAAEGNIQAAWSGYQSFDVAQHLGEIMLARGDKRAALTYFLLAQQTHATTDALGGHVDPTPREEALAARTEALRKQLPAKEQEPEPTLQKVRTLDLGSGSGGNAVAGYKLLLGPQGVVRAEPVGAKEVPEVMAKLNRLPKSHFIPEGSTARLVLQGFVNCHSNHCELILTP